MKNRPRLTDVARLAGVSTATVSAVVNNSVGSNIRVSPDTRQRVWSAVAQLGYVANPAARILAGGKNRILGIFTYEPIFPFQHHDFFYPFLVGIEEEAEAQGYHLLLFTNVTDEDGQRSIYHGDTNLLYMADGSILLGLNENKEELSRLQIEGYPFVYVGRREVPDTPISYVACDYITATAELVCRLAELGHRRLMYVGVPQYYEASIDRERGFVTACQKWGLQCDDRSILRVPADALTPERVKSLLDQGFSGAVVEWDDQCQALLASLRALGFGVPQDFSITMLGDPHYAWDHSPDWTMFTVPRREMGVEAVRLLLRRLNQPPQANPEVVSLPGWIVAGQTIAPPRRINEGGQLSPIY